MGQIGVRGEAHGDYSTQDEAAGVFGEGSSSGVGVAGQSNSNHGVVGISDASGKRGVFGFNRSEADLEDAVSQDDKADPTPYGVFGRCDASEGVGVGALSRAGVAVRGTSIGNDGLVGISKAEGRSGVFGFNEREGGFASGVFGLCNSPGGAGVSGRNDSGDAVSGVSTNGVGVRGTSTKSDGVVGKTHIANRSGVYGENTYTPPQASRAPICGVTGRADAPAGVGVHGTSKHGIGVHAVSSSNNGAVGETNTSGRSGVYGLNTAVSFDPQQRQPVVDLGPMSAFDRQQRQPVVDLGPISGVTGHADDVGGIGVHGTSKHGYGGGFDGGRAPLRLIPAAVEGAPSTGHHLIGELFVDSNGSLFFCKASGSPHTAVWVKIA